MGQLSGKSYVACGSFPDIRERCRKEPLSGAKRTSNVRFLSPKRSCADDVRLRGMSGLSGGPARRGAWEPAGARRARRARDAGGPEGGSLSAGVIPVVPVPFVADVTCAVTYECG